MRYYSLFSVAAWKVPIRVTSEAFEKYNSRKRMTNSIENVEPAAKRQKLMDDEDKQLLSVLPSVVSQDAQSVEERKAIIVLSGFSRALKETVRRNCVWNL